jgi:hypothetical protein
LLRCSPAKENLLFMLFEQVVRGNRPHPRSLSRTESECPLWDKQYDFKQQLILTQTTQAVNVLPAKLIEQVVRDDHIAASQVDLYLRVCTRLPEDKQTEKCKRIVKGRAVVIEILSIVILLTPVALPAILLTLLHYGLLAAIVTMGVCQLTVDTDAAFLRWIYGYCPQYLPRFINGDLLK